MVGREGENSCVTRRFKEDFDFKEINVKFFKKEVSELFSKYNKIKEYNQKENEKFMDDDDVIGETREVHIKRKYKLKCVRCKNGFFGSLFYGAPDHESSKLYTL